MSELSPEELAELFKEAEDDISASFNELKAIAKESKSFKTRQFTLISWPFLSVYLQGSLPIEDLELLESAPDFPKLHKLGVLKLRPKGYTPLSALHRASVINQISEVIKSGDLFDYFGTPSKRYRMAARHAVDCCPELATSMGGAEGFREKVFNWPNILATYSEWLEEARKNPDTAKAPQLESDEALKEVLELIGVNDNE